MPKYRSKVVEIEAIQWTGDNNEELEDFAGNKFVGNKFGVEFSKEHADIFDHLQDTWITVNPFDYIIKGMKGEFYPRDPEVFRATFEELDAQETEGS